MDSLTKSIKLQGMLASLLIILIKMQIDPKPRLDKMHFTLSQSNDYTINIIILLEL